MGERVKKRIVEIVEIIEDKWSIFTEKINVLPNGEVTERHLGKWQKTTRRILLLRTRQVSKWSKRTLKFIKDLIVPAILALIPEYLRKLIASIFGRSS